MNPSTDVGKKDLPPSLRSRFTEFFLGEPTNKRDLELIVKEYLKELDVPDKKVLKIVEFYAAIRKLCRTRLCDGTGHAPSFSLRTLCRALKGPFLYDARKILNVSPSLIVSVTHAAYDL